MYDELRRAILSGALPVGQQIVEAELAKRFGISKTPVREALKMLAGAGLVSMSDYRGASVRRVDATLAREVFDLRILLEPEAVRRSVAAGADLTAARQSLKASADAAGGADRSLSNRDFHHALYVKCGNSLLMSTLDGLRDQTALISVTAWAGSPTWDREAAEHGAILAAAESGDADRAASLVFDHIAAFADRAVTALSTTTRNQ